MASPILLLISPMLRRFVTTISPACSRVAPRAQKAVAVRGHPGLCRLRRKQAFPPAGHNRQDAAGRSWVPWHLVLYRRRDQHPLGRADAAPRTRPLEGTADVAYRTWKRWSLHCRIWNHWIWDRRIWDRRTWAYRIWEGQTWDRPIRRAWARWGGHPAQEAHSAFLHCSPGLHDKARTNDWSHKRREASVYGPQHALEDGRASIEPCLGPPVRARPEGLAAGTVCLILYRKLGPLNL
jgi:hypothetical protein